MYQQLYFVPKATGTLSDPLLAFGVADTLMNIVRPYAPSAKITLRDEGSYYVVDTGIPVQSGWIETIHLFVQIPFVKSKKKLPPDDLTIAFQRDVDDEWDTFRRYSDLRRQLGKQGKANSELEQSLLDCLPKSDWNVVTYLGDFRMQYAQDSHNKLAIQWLRSSEKLFQLNLQTFLALFAERDADWETIVQIWAKEAKPMGFVADVNASQMFSPSMGKGQNQSKSNKLTMGQESSFWMVEYLKAVGLWLATAPTKTNNGGLRKTYILAPRQIDMDFHHRVYEAFRTRLWNTGAVKQDILAVLLYTEVLLEHFIDDSSSIARRRGRISSIVSGMSVATYQLLNDLGYTMMNLAFLGLPDWAEIKSLDEAKLFRNIVQEHYERISSIGDETSDGYTLLQLYRDFVSGNYLDPFFEFCVQYSSYLVSELDRGHFYIKPFTETNMRRLLTMIDEKLFSTILKNEGFRNVAQAIRNSTLVPIYQGKKSLYEVRYGLAQELSRKAQYKEDFVIALGDFMQTYNDETLRVFARKGKQRRTLLTEADINQVIGLVDHYGVKGAKIVCSLLTACGYAREERESNKQATSGESANVSHDTEATPGASSV